MEQLLMLMLIEQSSNSNLHMIWWDNIKFQAFYVDHLSPSNRIMTLAILILLLDQLSVVAVLCVVLTEPVTI